MELWFGLHLLNLRLGLFPHVAPLGLGSVGYHAGYKHAAPLGLQKQENRWSER